LNAIARRAVLVFGIIFLAVWSVFLLSGAHSYFVDPSGYGSEGGPNLVRDWSSVGVDPGQSTARYPGIEGGFLIAVNEFRKESGLDTLTLDDTLSALARFDAAQMLELDYRGPVTPEGSRLADRVARWAPDRLGRSAEISADFTLAGSESVYVKGWQNTGRDLDIMKDPEFRRMGVGVAEQDGRYLAVVVFHEPAFRFTLALPLQIGQGKRLDVEAGYVGDRPTDNMRFVLTREARGWWKAHVLKRQELEPGWQGDRLMMEIPLKKAGMYRLEWYVEGVPFDRRPIKVGG
jgi:hypothetical protein